MHILELHLTARDLEGQHAFYRDVLGLPVVEETPSYFAVQAGTTKLVFEAVPGTQGLYHFAFNIPENRLAEAKSWLAGRTPLLSEEGEDEFESERWNAHMVYFRDADGNVLEFVARHDLDNGAPDDFGPSALLNVSEIGLPVWDVPEGVRWLSEALSLDPFREVSSTFAPLGDQHGLFIVVPVGRPWFPTRDGATVLPLTVVLATQQEGTLSAAGLPYLIRSEKEPPAGGNRTPSPAARRPG